MKVFSIYTVVAIFLAIGCIRAAPSLQDNRVEGTEDEGGVFSRVAKYLGACFESDDITTCLAVKGITALNRAARSNTINLSEGISFKRDDASPLQRSGKALSENEIVSQLPESDAGRTGRLMEMVMQSATDFLSTHNLEVKIPKETTQNMARAIEEGRGKMKKMLGPLVLAIGAKVFAIVPLVIFGLALLTFKAVFIAKIALLLALFLGGSRLFGGAGLGSKFGGSLGGYNAAVGNSAGWASSASSAYPYARSIQDDAQELAYSGQIPAQ